MQRDVIPQSQVHHFAQCGWEILGLTALIKMSKGLANLSDMHQFLDKQEGQGLHEYELHLLLEKYAGDTRKVFAIVINEEAHAVLSKISKWHDFINIKHGIQ